jgi:hypothetical protein
LLWLLIAEMVSVATVKSLFVSIKDNKNSLFKLPYNLLRCNYLFFGNNYLQTHKTSSTEKGLEN